MPQFVTNLAQRLRLSLARLQCTLNFDRWTGYPQFETKNGLGRVALLGCVLGIVWGIHVLLLLLLSLHRLGIVEIGIQDLLGPDRTMLLWQWCSYVVVVCTFHSAEFFITALYNPSVACADSFLVNHSVMYTFAVLSSWIEFWLRFLFFPWVNSTWICVLGVLIVIVAQGIRSVAMMTCGESFNHLIQSEKKKNHVLITTGIYKHLRHPSYVGFYYYSVGTQLLLCNPINTVLYAVASCMFFRRRIPFEEESLLSLFPDEYLAYATKSWIGIPFVRPHPVITRYKQE